jgi:hypothetical protein
MWVLPGGIKRKVAGGSAIYGGVRSTAATATKHTWPLHCHFATQFARANGKWEKHLLRDLLIEIGNKAHWQSV